MESRPLSRSIKRCYSFSESYREYKRTKTDFEVQEKSYEDLKKIFVKQHRKLCTRKQKYQSKLSEIETYRKQLSERSKNRDGDCADVTALEKTTRKAELEKTTRKAELEKTTRKAELKYVMALNSAETKFSLLESAYVMYEKSMLDFQTERMRFKQLSMELDER